MIWGIVVVAVIVLALGAWAGAGRLGEMPEPVNDRPKPHLPEGPVDQAFLDQVRIPRVGVGYAPSQVDAYLAGFVAVPSSGEHLEQSFDVVRGGYDMQAVDAVLERAAASRLPHERTDAQPEGLPSEADGAGRSEAMEDVAGTPVGQGPEEPGPPSEGAGVPEYGVVGDNRVHDQGISKD